MKTCLEVINSVKDPELKGNLFLAVPAFKLSKTISGLRSLLLSFSWSGSKQGYDYWESVYERIINGQILTEA